MSVKRAYAKLCFKNETDQPTYIILSKNDWHFVPYEIVYVRQYYFDHRDVLKPPFVFVAFDCGPPKINIYDVSKMKTTWNGFRLIRPAIFINFVFRHNTVQNSLFAPCSQAYSPTVNASHAKSQFIRVFYRANEILSCFYHVIWKSKRTKKPNY